jgi:desulfoferrodoxin (superoxide reductase-like protein)
MSKKLENSFKEKLENFEMPYEKSAWDQFSKKLDQTTTPKGKSFKPLHFAAMVVGIAAIGSVIYYATQNNDENLPQSKYNKELMALQNTDKSDDKIDQKETPIIETKSDESKEENMISTDDQKQINNGKETSVNSGPKTVKTTEEDNNINPVSDKKKQNEQIDNSSKTESKKENDAPTAKDPKRRFIAGTIVSTEICEGESVKIQNNDQEDGFVRIKLKNTDLTIPAGQFTEVKMTSSEDVLFLNEIGQVIERKHIIVHAKPQVDFTFEANLFENGLPVSYFNAYGTFKTFEWDFDNNQHARGAEVQTQFYEKGEYNVKLKVTDHNNCSTTKTRKVEIENEYNLMASNAFRPNDHDHRTRTFMPYALAQRDLDFELVIVDPKTHAVIFKSTDSSKGWDGIDQRTGQMTNANTTYVWKVHLENPLPGEKAIYMGMVVLKK